ncbi:MAG: hypothetical protein VXW87_01980 [Pseudomonadota bacterium]|nr:hypothetical protein [Pseudomonadota bacterium]
MPLDRIVKIHAQGNDFLLVPSTAWDTKKTETIKNLAHRRFGVGADQIVITNINTKTGQASLDIYNQDLSKATMCLNAAYACSQYLLSHDNTLAWSLNIGDCLFHAQPPHQLSFDATPFLSKPSHISIPHTPHAVQGLYRNTINEHFLIPTENPSLFPLEATAMTVLNSNQFPRGINISCYNWNGDTATVRTFERGVGPTYSCGSASLAVFLSSPQIRTQATIVQPGGHITFNATYHNGQPTTIYMQGQYSFIASILNQPNHPFD